MARNNSYETKQKDMILDVIKNNHKSFTIKDIHEILKDKVGLTTIDRLVDKLVEDGSLNKTLGDNNMAYYQYLEKCNHLNHFYLKCDNCGDLVHVDCDCISDLFSHMLEEHCFKANREKIVISGLCKKCNEGSNI